MKTPKLTDTQLVLLSAASQREDGLLQPPALKGGALQKVASKLVSLLFAEEVKVGRDDPAWRTDDAGSIGLKVTAAGLQAIGVESMPERGAEMPAAAGESAAPPAGRVRRTRSSSTRRTSSGEAPASQRVSGWAASCPSATTRTGGPEGERG